MKKTLYLLLLSVVSIFIVAIAVSIIWNSSQSVNSNSGNPNKHTASDSIIISSNEYLKDVRLSDNGSLGFEVPVSEIMERERKYGPLKSVKIPKKKEHIEPDRKNLPQNPESKDIPVFPPLSKEQIKELEERNEDNPQTIGTSFTGATLSTTGSFPPDNMGDVGPTQYIVAVNGRIITFSKTTGTADGVLNTTMDNFFASVMTPPVATNFTSDPRIRYDRQTQRWFILIIDVPGLSGNLPNRLLIGVSNTSTITNASNFTFFFYNQTDPNQFFDYPTIGLDAHAIYVGGNMFSTTSGSFTKTSGFVIKKSSITGGGPISVTQFLGLATGSGAGPYTPQGVDNFDASPTFGYFIGVDNATFGTLMLRRITDPGGTPTISSNISLTVSSTTFPQPVPHLGNTGGNNGRLDAIDDRLYNAVIRNGTLWTAHSIFVNSSGGTTSANRDGVRWYQIQNLSGTPSVVQSGTLFDNAASNPNYFWFPSVMVSGQGHAAFGFTHAGNNSRINAGTVGRLTGDVLGTLQLHTLFTSSSTAYNPPSDPGGSGGRRWGDYAYTSLDPNDDMTMWTVHQFCDNTNSYGCRVAKLIAPPPVTPSNCVPNSVNQGISSTNIVVTGSSVSGSGFFDPGAGFTNRISASISGNVTVNSITYNSPTEVTLNVSTVGATLGNHNITITNPDGQSATGNNLLDTPLPVELDSFTSIVTGRNVNLKWTTVSELNNSGFDIERKIASAKEWTKINFISGNGTTNSPVTYSYTDRNLNSGEYSYRLRQIDYNGNFEYFNLSNNIIIGIPLKFNLSQNFPNPFNPVTKINYDLPADGNVIITVYDVTGKVAGMVINTYQTSGFHTIDFKPSELGISGSGVYFYRISFNSNGEIYTETKKMMLVK